MEVDGHVALIAGGAGRRGAAVARALAEAGADVAILDIDGGRAAEVAAECLGYSQQCDVADGEHVAIGVSSAMARFGQAPRIVVNCVDSGLSARLLGPEGKTALPLFRRVVEVELIGAYNLLSYGAQAMMDMPTLDGMMRGVIVQRVGAFAGDRETARRAGAGGLAAMVEAAAPELGLLGIAAQAVGGRGIAAGEDEVAFARRVMKIIAGQTGREET